MGQVVARKPGTEHDGRMSDTGSDVTAPQAYAPYTRCPAGAAVIDGRGNVYRGAYLESAAFNPGLPPLQAALAAAVRAGLPSYDKVRVVMLWVGRQS